MSDLSPNTLSAKPRALPWRLGLGLARLVAFLAALWLSAYFSLGTESGQRWLTESASGAKRPMALRAKTIQWGPGLASFSALDAAITDVEGTVVLGARVLGVRWSPLGVWTGQQLDITETRGAQIVVNLEWNTHGVSNLSQAFGAPSVPEPDTSNAGADSTDESEDPGPGLTMTQIDLGGRVRLAWPGLALVFEGVQARGRLSVHPKAGFSLAAEFRGGRVAVVQPNGEAVFTTLDALDISIYPDGLEVHRLVLKGAEPKAPFEASGTIAFGAQPQWTFEAQGSLAAAALLPEVRKVLPQGVSFGTVSAAFANGQGTVHVGRLIAPEIDRPDVRARGVQTDVDARWSQGTLFPQGLVTIKRFDAERLAFGAPDSSISLDGPSFRGTLKAEGTTANLEIEAFKALHLRWPDGRISALKGWANASGGLSDGAVNGEIECDSGDLKFSGPVSLSLFKRRVTLPIDLHTRDLRGDLAGWVRQQDQAFTERVAPFSALARYTVTLQSTPAGGLDVDAEMAWGAP